MSTGISSKWNKNQVQNKKAQLYSLPVNAPSSCHSFVWTPASEHNIQLKEMQALMENG